MLEMPTLETNRLLIRPFVMGDLPEVHRLFDIELHAADLSVEKLGTLEERTQWLQWTVLNYRQLALLNQPPYGDRAIILKSNGSLVGSCGFVPCLNAFEQLPYFAAGETTRQPGRYSAEFGLFYAISPACQRQGYASEAAQALIDYAFKRLNLKRIIAATNHDNIASIGVMRKLGMRIDVNSHPETPWLQVVGILENPWQG